jgi:fumarylacetoacetate (FAA) hydrolase
LKLATLKDGSVDGRLVVVSRDLSRCVPAGGMAPTLQSALESWDSSQDRLNELSDKLNQGFIAGTAFDQAAAAAPLPRAWQWLDGSVYLSHGVLIAQAYGLPNPQGERPLMYQGMSHCFLEGHQDVPLPSEDDGIDFEGEFGVITDAVPMGVTPAAARDHIKLLIQINDWSLRVLGREEMNRGYGWVRAKPACSAAPIALTPDELGNAWKDARIHLPLHIWWNGEPFGAANGGEMAFGFDELVAHAAYSRSLCAGTIVGSGTVANANFREVGSSCIAERHGIEMLDFGERRTPFMKFGDTVRMEARDRRGATPFGTIAQTVIRG